MTLYELNRLMAVVFALSLASLFLLMTIIWPRTRLNALAFTFIGSCTAVMVRSVLAAFWPTLFGERHTVVPSVIFAVATVSTCAFAVGAWVEYTREAINWRDIGLTPLKLALIAALVLALAIFLWLPF